MSLIAVFRMGLGVFGWVERGGGRWEGGDGKFERVFLPNGEDFCMSK